MASVTHATTVATARTIVLVEDSDDIRVTFRELLEHSGYRVEEAPDGIEGLARILAVKPDVAIIDVGLPRMNGYEVARRVRAALGSTVMLIAMTGHSNESDRLEALAAGFDSHVSKPVDLALLERILTTGRGPN